MAKTIMFQGTASGVGKSTLCIGFCRALARRGVRVAPFKAQNLSDNAHRLPDGRQMARSQAMAAAACGLEPHPDMNPILLKPARGGCETVVNGHVVDGLSCGEMKAASLAAYRRLAAEYDVIVAEGAGSPVELNLRDGDIVNMGFATQVGCPVILVADIRRGGVFAAAHGTAALLRPQERALLKGLIVNDFCGDPASFAEGRRLLEEVTGVPVLGVVPHLELHLEDEDDLPGADTQTRERLAALVPEGMSFEAYQLQQIDHLADVLCGSLDFPAIEDILKGAPTV